MFLSDSCYSKLSEVDLGLAQHLRWSSLWHELTVQLKRVKSCLKELHVRCFEGPRCASTWDSKDESSKEKEK